MLLSSCCKGNGWVVAGEERGGTGHAELWGKVDGVSRNEGVREKAARTWGWE